MEIYGEILLGFIRKSVMTTLTTVGETRLYYVNSNGLFAVYIKVLSATSFQLIIPQRIIITPIGDYDSLNDSVREIAFATAGSGNPIYPPVVYNPARITNNLNGEIFVIPTLTSNSWIVFNIHSGAQSAQVVVNWNVVPPLIATSSSTSTSLFPYQSSALSVSASGGTAGYTHQWSISGEGNISNATSTSYLINGHSFTQETNKTYICTIKDSSSPQLTITKSFPITFKVPDAVGSTTPSAGQYAPVAGTSSAVNSSVSGGLTVNPPLSSGSFTLLADSVQPPSTTATTYLEVKSQKVTDESPEVVEFVVNKKDSNGSDIISALDNSGTFSTLQFECASGNSFIIAWGGEYPSRRLVKYTATSEAIQYFSQNKESLVTPSPYSVKLTDNGIVSEKRRFTYFGPNSSTYMIVIPAGVSALPCFTAGTRILTPTGEKLVENLKTGDLVLTADGREVPAQIYSTNISKTTTKTAPYVIPAHSFGATPVRDLIVSAKHAVQSSKGVWQIPEFCSKAKQLPAGQEVAYYHIELPNYFTDNIVANGAVCESLANKQVNRSKTLYTYSKKLGGFLRASQDSSKSISKH